MLLFARAGKFEALFRLISRTPDNTRFIRNATLFWALSWVVLVGGALIASSVYAGMQLFLLSFSYYLFLLFTLPQSSSIFFTLLHSSSLFFTLLHSSSLTLCFSSLFTFLHSLLFFTLLFSSLFSSLSSLFTFLHSSLFFLPCHSLSICIINSISIKLTG
jgi:hypothetical protein